MVVRVVREDLELLDDGGEILKSQGRGWRFESPGCEISSLFDEKLVRWSTTSCALVLASPPFVSK